MKLKLYKSHLSISSIDESKENKKSKNKFTDIEKYMNKLILISLKTKKFYEKNDYFYEEEKRKKFDLKNIKIKLTPFQKYQRYKTKKTLTTEKQINNSKTILYNYPINNRIRKNKINPNLFTINNTYIKRMRKNKTNQNNQFYHTHHNFFFKPKKKLILQPNQLTEPNVYQTINNNNIKFNPRSKSNYQTINIHKTNKIIQTNESNKKIGDKVNITFDQFPILDVFNSKSKINENWIKNKLKKQREERKKRIPFVNINKAKFSNILLNY